MTAEKRNALIYVVAGVLWPGLIALVVSPIVAAPNPNYSEHTSVPVAFLAIWFSLLFWPTIIAGFKRIQGEASWRGYKRARLFFWLSLVLSLIMMPLGFI